MLNCGGGGGGLYWLLCVIQPNGRAFNQCVCAMESGWKMSQFRPLLSVLVMPLVQPFIFSPIVVRSAMFFISAISAVPIAAIMCSISTSHRPQLIFPDFHLAFVCMVLMDVLAQARMGRTMRRNNIENHDLSLIFVVFMKIQNIMCSIRRVNASMLFFRCLWRSWKSIWDALRTGTECV